MKERPILFSAPMIRAILEGRKTQTRRVVKPTNGHTIEQIISTPDSLAAFIRHRCPYGQPGDRLWVREAFRFLDSFDGDSPATVGARCLAAGYPKPWAPTQYEADGCRDNWMHVGTPPSPGSATPGKLRPGIHMPRWASRINLEITAVRVERLNDISEADAMAEGVTVGEDRSFAYAERGMKYEPHREAFEHLWESINGPRSWAADPWVWVVEFKRARHAT